MKSSQIKIQRIRLGVRVSEGIYVWVIEREREQEREIERGRERERNIFTSKRNQRNPLSNSTKNQ